MKKCDMCKRELPDSCFGNNKSKPDGFSTTCRECKSKMDKAYRARNLEECKQKAHNYYITNKETIVAKVNKYIQANREKHNEWGTKSKNRVKAEVLSRYCCGDNPECKCCGETDIDVLSIDHVDGDGAEHRREIGKGRTFGGARFYFWLKRNNYPDGFQVLCFNCQFKKRLTEIRPENPTHLQQVRARYTRSIKLECLGHYGGLRCDCGVDDADVLTLDHVNDDGAEHRRETGTRGFNFYMMLRKSDFPNEPPLQVMCLNCQIKKRQRKYEEGKIR